MKEDELIKEIAKTIGDAMCSQGQWHYSDYGSYDGYDYLPHHLQQYFTEPAEAVLTLIRKMEK